MVLTIYIVFDSIWGPNLAKIANLNAELLRQKEGVEIWDEAANSLIQKHNNAIEKIGILETQNKSLSVTFNEFLSQNQQMGLQIKGYQEQVGALKIAQVESEQVHTKDIQLARKDAVDTSRAVLKGQISEEMAPFLPEFPYESSDARFMGSPIDLVIFEGMSKGLVTGIVLVDIKTGKSALNKVQKQIKECVEKGRVSFYKHSIG